VTSHNAEMFVVSSVVCMWAAGGRLLRNCCSMSPTPHPTPHPAPQPPICLFNFLLSCNCHMQAFRYYAVHFAIGCTKRQSHKCTCLQFGASQNFRFGISQALSPAPGRRPPIFSHLLYLKGSYRSYIYSWNDNKQQQFEMQNTSLR